MFGMFYKYKNISKINIGDRRGRRDTCKTTKKDWQISLHICLDGLVRFGLIWFCMVWNGVAWFGVQCPHYRSRQPLNSVLVTVICEFVQAQQTNNNSSNGGSSSGGDDGRRRRRLEHYLYIQTTFIAFDVLFVVCDWVLSSFVIFYSFQILAFSFNSLEFIWNNKTHRI